MGLGRYTSAFAENDVDETVLGQLDDADLGISASRHSAIASNCWLIAARRAAPPATAPAASAHRRATGGSTHLFADLSVFTALSQTLDPEELHR